MIHHMNHLRQELKKSKKRTRSQKRKADESLSVSARESRPTKRFKEMRSAAFYRRTKSSAPGIGSDKKLKGKFSRSMPGELPPAWQTFTEKRQRKPVNKMNL
jgi:hypothetical protein